MALSGCTYDSCKTRLVRIALISVSVLMVGCSVSKSMRVRTGEDPVHKDSDVRFRTTYYFRVFDACEGLGEVPNTPRDDTVLKGVSKGPYHLRTDSLYRFRMTGKGYSLFQRIHFESGTLRKEEIDPFGSIVAFDSKTNRFIYKSREETQSDARREARFADIERLRALRDNLKENKMTLQEIDQIILKQIRGLSPTDVISTDDVKRGAAAMPTMLGEFVAARDRAQRLVQEAGVLREVAKGPGKSLGVAASSASTRAPQVYDEAKKRQEAVRVEVDEASKVPDLLRDAGGATAQQAITQLNTTLMAVKLTAIARTTPSADAATATDIENARAELERFSGAVPRALQQTNAVVATLDGLRTAGTQVGANADKIAVAYLRAQGLRDVLTASKERADAARAALATAGTVVRTWRAVNAAELKRKELEDELTPPGALDTKGKAAASDLIDVAKKADDAAAAAADATRELLKGNAATTEAQAYGTKAAALARGVDAPRTSVANAAGAFQQKAAEARDVLRGLADAERGGNSNVAAARAAFEELATRLTAIASTWDDLGKSVAAQAGAATQIAATMTPTARRPPDVGAKSTSAGPDLVPCPSGTTARRGFQVLGPEGWRTFDQDERLIMAMSSSAKPLLGALQEISRNVLSAQHSPADALLPLVKERLRILETDRKAERYEKIGGTVDQIIDDLLATFGRAVGPEARQ